jgi:hypothetical protein
MKDKIEFDGDKLDPGFVRLCARQAEEKLYEYVGSPDADPTLSPLLSMFLNRVGLMRGMLKAIVDIHNGVVSAHRASEDPSKGTDVSVQLQHLALLATGCAVNFGDEIGHVVVKFRPETGDIEFDNMAGRGVNGPPDGGRSPGTPAAMTAPYGDGPDEPDELIDPLLAAHDKGLH